MISTQGRPASGRRQRGPRQHGRYLGYSGSVPGDDVLVDMRAAIVGRYNFTIERDLLRPPAHAEARFTRSVLLSRTAANCALLPHIETVVYFRTAGFFRGADFLRGAAFGGLSASLTALPA